MYCAGKRASKTSWFSNGACSWANGMQPESNQTSMTSGTRVIGASHSGHGKRTSST